MTVTNSTRMKHANSKPWDNASHSAVSAKADDTLCRSEKDGTESNPNLSVFRIPRIPNRKDVRSSNASVDPRCERKTVNFGPATALKMDTQKHCSSKVNFSAAHATDIRSRSSSTCKLDRSGWTNTVSKSHTLHGSSETRKKLTGAVHSQSAKPHCDSHASVDTHASKQQLQSSIVNRDKVRVARSDPQEVTPKLPEELIRAGWKLCWSKHRHRWYVFNVRTGTSSWDVPK